MKHFFAAMRFLTILPLPESWAGGAKELSYSLPYFPLVGLLIGIAIAALDWELGHLLPVFPTSVLVVIAMLAVSGGLHIDGLADTADGFFSSRPRDRVLEIMKDSRTGPMGVAAIVCVIALKVAAVVSIPRSLRFGTLLLMPLAGRCALLTTIALFPYARPEGGLAEVFQRNRSRLHAAWSLAILLVVGWFAAKSAGMAAGVISFAFVLGFAVYAHRKIGGYTGDTLGAACELVEVAPALVAAAWMHG